MQSAPPCVALAFAGTFTGAFAFALAFAAAEPAHALGALVIATYCCAEFILQADFWAQPDA